MTELPVAAVLPDLLRALADPGCAVLQAPPGAGKTTRVPPALLTAPWIEGRRVVMLEPRRFAARAAAAFMAEQMGETVGETVGYRMRLDSRVGPHTRIEVVTEGVLTRRLLADPELADVSCLIFDEFHERSLQADLGLALALECRAVLRPDLRIVVMSATLDGTAVARLLDGAPVIASEGRTFPVETRHLAPAADRPEAAVAAAVRRALAEEEGSILAFLPGEAEIRRVAALLAEPPPPSGIRLAPLYGALPRAAQDEAIRPPPASVRKVVLATAIAETSLTIDGVRVIIDGGYMRVPRFDPRSGMTRLETVRVSLASADQRRGRAGRTGPGVCYRLWPEAATRGLVPFNRPEILEADLAPLVLDLAQWGTTDPASLRWLDPPPAAALAQGRDLLVRLGALDRAGRITVHGKAMAELPLHPRLAHMVVKGAALDLGALACEAAALLGERDVLAPTGGERDADFRLRIEALRGTPPPAGFAVRRHVLAQVAEAARRWRRRFTPPTRDESPERIGRLVALAYPDRVAKRRATNPAAGEGQFLLANGRGAALPLSDPLSAADWLAVADLDGAGRDARIFLAAPIDRAEIAELFADDLRTVEHVAWDDREEAVAARRQVRFGELVLEEAPLKDPPAGAVQAALLRGIAEMGLGCLPWTPDLTAWRARVAFLRRLEGAEAWPDLSDAALGASLADWLGPFLDGITRRAHLARIDLTAALHGLLAWPQRKALDERAPTHVTVPSGSRRPVDYAVEEGPVLAVRLQEMFGLAETPTVAGGRVRLLLHLLSPAGRPVQVTRDLASFWKNGYPAVRADLRGRYPKHFWPDDPLAAPPTARAKRPGA